MSFVITDFVNALNEYQTAYMHSVITHALFNGAVKSSDYI
jgi:hypothetical protein